MSAKQIKIDWNKVGKYLQAQCSGVGIASILGVHENTLYNACKRDLKVEFVEYSALKKGEGKELLRMKQFSIAMDGEKSMLIWLGKQYLEQRDKNELTGRDGKDLNTTIQIELIDSSDKVNENTGSE